MDVTDPGWEEYQKVLDKRSEKEAADRREIRENLPSWEAVDAAITAISSLAEAKVFIRKLARVVFLAVNR